MLQCDVKSDDLACELALCEKVMRGKPAMPALGCALLTVADGRLALAATNLQVGVRASLDAPLALSGCVAVPVAQLAELARRLPGAVLTLKEAPDGASVQINGGRFSGRLQLQPASDFPAMGEAIGPWAEWPGAPFAVGIRQAESAAPAEASKYTIGGVLVQRLAAETRLVATDGHRLVLARLAVPNGTEAKLLIPRGAVDLILAAAEGHEDAPIRVASTENLHVFEVGGRQIFARQVEGQFPAYERVLTTPAGRPVTLLRAALADAVRRIQVVTADAETGIRIASEGGQVRVSTEAAGGAGSEPIEAAGAVEGEATRLNTRYLLDALTALGTEHVELTLGGGMTPVRLKTPDTEECQCLIMPLRQ